MINHYSPFRRHTSGMRIENKAAEEATIYIYDVIDPYWGIKAADFVKEVNGIKAKTINVRINSPGGAVFEGVSMYNALKQHAATVIVHVDGLAASIASVIAMAGDEIRMGEGAYMMIHDPWSFVAGTAEDMRTEAAVLDKVGGTISSYYQQRTGKSDEEIKQLMADETWMTADEAVAAGFADSVVNSAAAGNSKAAATQKFDLSVFGNVPAGLQEQPAKQPTEREIERALINLGVSAKRAKTMIANMDDEAERDAGTVTPDAPEEGERDADTNAGKIIDKTNNLLILAEQMAPGKGIA